MAASPSRRKCFASICLAAISVCLASCSRSPASATASSVPRHVLLIALDTTRADHLGCYGHPTVQTPVLDRLAAEGLRFENAVAAAPTTLAAHASILTGLYPHRHGVPRNGYRMDAANVLLAERLKAAGFDTAAFIGSFALHSQFGLNQGFDVYDEQFDVLTATMGDGQDQRRADRVSAAASAYINAFVGKRLFMFVHYFDPHAPHDPPIPYDTMYPRADIPVPHNLADGIDQAVATHQQQTLGQTPGKVWAIENGLTPRLLIDAPGEPLGDDGALDALYCGEISFMDHHIGRVIEALKNRKLFHQTLIVVVGDHGETMWEHGDYWNHGLWVYDTTVHVPLIVRLPGDTPRGRSIDARVSTVDIVPSILEWLRLPPAENVDGVSFAPLVAGSLATPRTVFSEATQPYRVEVGTTWENANKAACVCDGQWKYIYAPYLEFEQLFDLKADPGERTNLLAHPEGTLPLVLTDLRQKLHDWRQQAAPAYSEFNPLKSEETLRKLKDLGYIGGSSDDDGDDD